MSHIFSNTWQIIVAKNGSYNLDVFKKIWQTKKNLEQWQRYVLQSCFAITLVLLTKDTSYHVCIESFKKKKDDRRRLWKYMKLYGKYGRGFLDWFSWPLLCWQYRPPSARADLSCNWLHPSKLVHTLHWNVLWLQLSLPSHSSGHSFISPFHHFCVTFIIWFSIYTTASSPPLSAPLFPLHSFKVHRLDSTFSIRLPSSTT